nr:hypothetical protein [Tanacetum cinerariifolium]
MRLKKAKEALEVLKQEFRGDIKVRCIKLQTLRRDYENTKMKENELLNDYSSRLIDLINQMKSYGDEIEDQRIVEKILISIPEKFDPIIAVIENTKDLKTLGNHDLLSSLKSYEQRMTRHSGKTIESAFQSSLQGDKKSQPNFGRRNSSRGGRGGRNSGGRGRGQSYERGRGLGGGFMTNLVTKTWTRVACKFLRDEGKCDVNVMHRALVPCAKVACMNSLENRGKTVILNIMLH